MASESFPKTELPGNLRGLIKLSIEQAHRAFEVWMKANEDARRSIAASSGLARYGAVALQGKVMEITRANADASFLMALKLAESQHIGQVMELYADHLRKRMNALAGHLEDIRDLTFQIICPSQGSPNANADVTTSADGGAQSPNKATVMKDVRLMSAPQPSQFHEKSASATDPVSAGVKQPRERIPRAVVGAKVRAQNLAARENSPNPPAVPENTRAKNVPAGSAQARKKANSPEDARLPSLQPQSHARETIDKTGGVGKPSERVAAAAKVRAQNSPKITLSEKSASRTTTPEGMPSALASRRYKGVPTGARPPKEAKKEARLTSAPSRPQSQGKRAPKTEVRQANESAAAAVAGVKVRTQILPKVTKGVKSSKQPATAIATRSHLAATPKGLEKGNVHNLADRLKPSSRPKTRPMR
jgi:hypothetical protein